MSNIGGRCDICGYEHKTSVFICLDEIRRCTLCRQRARWGKTFFSSDDEFEWAKVHAPIIVI